MRKIFMALLAVATLGWAAHAKADIVDVDTSGASEFAFIVDAFVNAEDFITTDVVNDFERRNMPSWMYRQLRKVNITTEIADLGDGVIADAAVDPDTIVSVSSQRWNRAVAQDAHVRVNRQFIEAGIFTNDDWRWILTHEIMHGMGFNPLIWEMNDLTDVVRNDGLTDYVGANGLRAFRRESGVRFARFIPLERAGGGGTAGAHWALGTPFLDQRSRGFFDVMLGFYDNNLRPFLSNTTKSAFADWSMILTENGFTGGSFGGGGNGGGKFPPDRFGSAIPEPASGALFAFAVGAMVCRRRR